jgi:solute carrier family 35 (GDP-fucose transporter), member C1
VHGGRLETLAGLKFVEVSFYNVARSLTIVFNVILSFFILGDTTSNRVLGCLAVVILGFFVGAGSEMRFSWFGTLSGVMSSLFVSLNSIYTKEVMNGLGKYVEPGKDKMWLLSGVNNVIATALFLPVFLITEADVLVRSTEVLSSGQFWLIMCVAGVLGFLIGIATVMQISVTSPLTHNISGTAKAAVQTAGAFMIWQNPTNVWNILGLAMTLIGSMMYTWVRLEEGKAPKAAPPIVVRDPSPGDGEQP